jgi:hypothetical protein
MCHSRLRMCNICTGVAQSCAVADVRLIKHLIIFVKSE